MTHIAEADTAGCIIGEPVSQTGEVLYDDRALEHARARSTPLSPCRDTAPC